MPGEGGGKDELGFRVAHEPSTDWAWEKTNTQNPRYSGGQGSSPSADCPAPLTALEDSLVCQSHSCPTNYCYNHGHCYISEAPGCQPTCTCPPAFTDTRCFLAGNDFTPTISKGMAKSSCHPYQPHVSLLPGWECWENQCLRPKFPQTPRLELSFPSMW